MVRAKGGNVQGKVGAQYANRTDLARQEPVTTAPGQEYGQRSQQHAAQRAVPLAPPPQSSPLTGGAPSAPTPQAPPQMSSGPAPAGGPGLVPFLHPTNRPNEPVTAGLATGPGPGPEVLTGVGAVAANQSGEQGTLRNLLGSLATGPASSTAIRDLAAVAGA